jgi:RNA polymerase primary sigma factor
MLVPPKPRAMNPATVQRQGKPRRTSPAVSLDWDAQPQQLEDEPAGAPSMALHSDDATWVDIESFEDEPEAVGLAVLDQDCDDDRLHPSDDEVKAVLTPLADDDDLVRLYLNEMGQYSRLTGAEEIALAQKIEEGQRSAGRKRLEAREQKSLQVDDRAPAAGPYWVTGLTPEAARAHMIRANLRLVVSIAKQFVGRGLSLLDLIQEGNLGLMKAVDRFDWRRGCRFGTYASWWIKQAIGRAIGDQGRMIRLPAHMADSIGRVHRLRQSWLQMYEVEPTTEELAKLADVSQERLESIEQLTTPPVSIDWPLPDGERTVSDLLPDDSTLPPIDLLLESERHRLLHALLRDLTARERRILRMHFGIGQRRSYTLEEIGQTFHLTRERIRQIELKALKKLRHPHRRRLLEECVATSTVPKPMPYDVEISVDAEY